jgi:hypothetical protein
MGLTILEPTSLRVFGWKMEGEVAHDEDRTVGHNTAKFSVDLETVTRVHNLRILNVDGPYRDVIKSHCSPTVWRSEVDRRLLPTTAGWVLQVPALRIKILIVREAAMRVVGRMAV